jgi:hypothetical protein
MKMWEDFALNFSENTTGVHHDNAQSLTQLFTGSFWPETTDCRPHPPYFPLFPRLKIKLECSHFDTIEVIEAESKAVLHTIKEHDFQSAFKKWQKR